MANDDLRYAKGCGYVSAVNVAPCLWIGRRSQLIAWVEHCHKHTVLGVDTEGDSAFRYRERVCLIQMTAGQCDALIDPLSLDSLEPLRPLFANPHQIKVFHDAGYDLLGLLRDYGFATAGIFDTMLASRLLGYRQFGLGSILTSRFHFKSNKRWQKSDWGQRPLNPAQLEYARYDSHFLPILRRQLTAELIARNRLYWAEEEFNRLPHIARDLLQRLQANAKVQRRDGFCRYHGYAKLSHVAKRNFAALWQWREKTAQRLDRPLYRVASDALLEQLALQAPFTWESLQTAQLPPRFVARFGSELVRVTAQLAPIHWQPPATVADPPVDRQWLAKQKKNFDTLRKWRAQWAKQLDLDPEVFLGNQLLKKLVAQPPASLAELLDFPELSGWRAPMVTRDLWPALQILAR